MFLVYILGFCYDPILLLIFSLTIRLSDVPTFALQASSSAAWTPVCVMACSHTVYFSPSLGTDTPVLLQLPHCTQHNLQTLMPLSPLDRPQTLSGCSLVSAFLQSSHLCKSSSAIVWNVNKVPPASHLSWCLIQHTLHGSEARDVPVLALLRAPRAHVFCASQSKLMGDCCQCRTFLPCQAFSSQLQSSEPCVMHIHGAKELCSYTHCQVCG